jgi:hypothetical protein
VASDDVPCEQSKSISAAAPEQIQQLNRLGHEDFRERPGVRAIAIRRLISASSMSMSSAGVYLNSAWVEVGRELADVTAGLRPDEPQVVHGPEPAPPET